MDGSALAEPYRFTFRARGPTLFGGFPVGPDAAGPKTITPNQRFELVYSTPIDLANELDAIAIGKLRPKPEPIGERGPATPPAASPASPTDPKIDPRS